MLQEFLEYLQGIYLSDAILFCIVIGWVLLKLFKAGKGALDKHTEYVQSQSKKAETFLEIQNNLKSTQKEINDSKEYFEQKINSLKDMLEMYTKNQGEYNEKTKNAINELNQLLTNQGQKMENLEDRVDKIETQIELLFRSDKEYMRAYIIEGHATYVKGHRSIDLLTLQSIEGIYNTYLEEGGVNDEFLAKLMTEIRNIPTTKNERKKNQDM